MGKRRKRMTMPRYAKKYAKKRAALGYDTPEVENKMIEIDMTTGEEIKEQETVQVVSNVPEVTPDKDPAERVAPAPLPGLQTITIEEPAPSVPEIVMDPPKTTRKKTSTRKTSIRKAPRKKASKE